MNYFNYIREYLEKKPSLQCIPVKEKAPFIPEWQSIEVTEDVIDHWEDRFQGIADGFGVRAGQHNIGWADYDTDDVQLIHTIDEVLNLSQICVKKGMKGKTVFFRFEGSPNKNKYNIKLRPSDKKAIVEINLTVGQTVLPPSIHPQTKTPYVWVGESLLDIDIEDLPMIDLQRVEHLEEILRAPSLLEGLKNVPSSIVSDGSGKFHTITREATRLLNLGADELTIARSLVSMDRILFSGNQFFLSNKIGKDLVSPTNDIENATVWISTYKSNLMRQDKDLREKLSTIVRTKEVIAAGAEWMPIKPLLSKKEALDFPDHLFPEALKSYCFDHARASTLPPEAYLGALFTTFSAVCQAKVYIKVTNIFSLHPNISTIVVAPSGSRKDAIFNSACAPLMKLINKQKDLYRGDMIEQERTICGKIEELSKKRKKAIEHEDDSAIKEINLKIIELQGELITQKKKNPRFIFESGTQEMLYELMNQNQDRGIFIKSSEYVQLLGNLSKKGNESLRGFYLKLLNGEINESFSHQTKTGVNVDIRKVVGSALIGAQTDVLAKDIKQLESGHQADGLLQRFFLINVEPKIERMEDVEIDIDTSRVDNLFALMYNHESDIHITWDNDETRQCFKDYEFHMKLKLVNERSVIKSFRSKYIGQCVKVAFIYEQCNLSAGKIATKITKKSLLLSIEWLEWQSRSLDIVWSAANYNAALRVADLVIEAIKSGTIRDANFYNDVQKLTRCPITDLNNALDLLIDCNYIRRVGNLFEVNKTI